MMLCSADIRKESDTGILLASRFSLLASSVPAMPRHVSRRFPTTTIWLNSVPLHHLLPNLQQVMAPIVANF